MDISCVSTLYFSPTGNVRRVVTAIAEGLGGGFADHDLTPFEARWSKRSFKKDECVVIGMPVYGGRIPDNFMEFFRGLTADRSPAVFVVSYGNRDYEDALAELRDRCEERGFVGIAAGAFIGQHACAGEIARGRPDVIDMRAALEFGARVRRKLQALSDVEARDELPIKGNKPYTRGIAYHIAPTTDSACDRCGHCARVCPMAAIDPSNTAEVDRMRCIACFRCIQECPRQAKRMDDKKFLDAMAMLPAQCATRKETELFL